MEVQNAKQIENEKTLGVSVVEKDEDSGKDAEMVAEAEKDENDAAETSAGGISMDAKPEESVLNVPVEENKTKNVTVEELSVLASVEPSSSGIKKPRGLWPKTKIVKTVKRLVKRKKKATAVQVAGEENVTVVQGIKEDITAVNIKKDEQIAEPSLGKSEQEIMKVIDSVEDSPPCYFRKDKDSETSLGGNDIEFKEVLENFTEAPQPTNDDEKVAGTESSDKEILKEVKGEASILKSVGKRLRKGTKVKGTLAQGMNKESASILEGDSRESDKRDAGSSPGGNMMEADKNIEGSVETSKIVLSVEKKQLRKLKGKAKLRKTPAALLATTKVDRGTPQLEQNDQKENNNSLGLNEQSKGAEKLKSVEVNTSERDEQKTFAEKNRHNQLTEDKNGLAENKRRKKKRLGKQVLGSNKKQKKEIVAASHETQKIIQERKEQLVDPEQIEMDGRGKVQIGGLIFMCNTKTRPDCFRFSVMGVQEKRKDYVMGIKPGLKLFLYDYDLKLLYGVFEASSEGGMKLERNAFGGSFPAQVRFKVISDCVPLPESEFKKAIKEIYNNKNKFKTELNHKQVVKLRKLFRPAPLPAQLTHTQPILFSRNADRKRSDKDRHAPGSSRTHLTHTYERRSYASPPPREAPPHDLYPSEREYRTFGLRRAETTQHYPILPPDSSYHSVNRDHVPLDSYHPSVNHDRLLRLAEIERHHDRREVRLLNLPERDYRPHDHLSARREILPRVSPDPPASAVSLDTYRRGDPYEYHAPDGPPRTYLTSSGREEDDLYSRYITADSLAEYYRSSSRRYPSIAEYELPPSSITSRYAYPGSLSYSHR